MLKKNKKIILLLCIISLFLIFYKLFQASLNPQNREKINQKILTDISRFNFDTDEKINLLFTGDIFLDRGIDAKSKKSPLKYAYPFSGLDTLDREQYDAWIGNLECPVTLEQSTIFEKENYLKFSCKKEYLPELKKYFDIVSLANNHTNNMNGRAGIEETRAHLRDANIKYFGDFDNSVTDEVCKIIYIKTKNINFPVAFCGYHGVFKLPTEEEIGIINNYSKYFITFVVSHQGEEYKFVNNSFQEKIYHAFVDNGADAVIGSHPHVIQNVEEYKGKKIFYSLGNFIFDQHWAKTREHMVVKTVIDLPKYENNYRKLNCENLTNSDCLEIAKKLNIQKPKFTLDFEQIYTHADLDFVTRKK